MRNKFRLIFKLGFVVIFGCMFIHLRSEITQLWTYLRENLLASSYGIMGRIPVVLPYVALAAGLRQIYKLLYIDTADRRFRGIWVCKAAVWLLGFVYCLYWNDKYLDSNDYVMGMVLREAFNFFPVLCGCYLAEVLLRVSVNQKMDPLQKTTPFPQILRWVSRVVHFQWNPKNEIIHYGFCLVKAHVWVSATLLVLDDMRRSLFLSPWGEDTVWSFLCGTGHDLLTDMFYPLAILCLVEWLFFDRQDHGAKAEQKEACVVNDFRQLSQ